MLFTCQAMQTIIEWCVQAKQTLYTNEVLVTLIYALHAEWKGHDADHALT